MHPTIARTPRLATQQRGDPSIAESRPLPSYLAHPLGQRFLIVTRFRFVTLTAPRLVDHLARPSLGDHELDLQLADHRTLPGRAYQFPSATYFSILMSSACSATISLSFLFSS